MAFINSILCSLFDLLLLPFDRLPAWIPLTLLAAAMAVAALLVYKKFSDQAALERVKARIAAGFYEIRLFNDNLTKILKALGGLLRNNGVYVALSLVPLLVMLLPMGLAFAQLQFHYGYHGLQPHQSTTVTMTFTDDAVSGSAPPSVELEAPEGVEIETPAVWIPSKRQLAWRVVGEQPGRFQLMWTLPEGKTDKSLVVSNEYQRISPVRYEKGLLHQLLYPAEPPIAAALPVHSITVGYASRSIPFLGLELPWWLIWFLMSVVVALMIRDRMGVTF